MSMSGGGTQNSLRKTLGALKDTTTVSLAKINSGYKELDIAIVNATNHVEQPAKEKYIRAISATRPRADVAYCIHALARRLSKTHNWARTKDLDTSELLEQLPALQQLLYRIIGCQPQGASVHNFVIQVALSMVASESIKIYNAVSDGTVNLVDKFFEMQRNDALRSLDIYRRAGQQAGALSEFYEICKSIDVGCGEKFIKIEQPPASFLQAMEEYVREAPRASTVRKDSKPKVILAIEYKKDPEVKDVGSRSPPPPEPKPEPVKTEASPAEPADLLSLDDPSPAVAEIDEENPLALAIIPVGSTNPPTSTGSNLTNGTGWELSLVEAPSSNESTATASKLAGGLDKLTLDSLYDDAMRQTNQNVSYNPWEQPAPAAAPMMHNVGYDPFYVSNMVVAPTNVQMAAMANQQQAFMFQQQQQMMMMTTHQPQQNANPFANPYGANANPYCPGMPVQTAYNPYNTGLI